MLTVAGLLSLTLWLPQPTRWSIALAAIVLLGVPHGALDGEIARPLLRPRWGWRWFGVFALPYLGLVALVLIAWRVAPLPTLAAFLAGSVWHFGLEDAGPHPLAAAVRGGLPIAAPVLFHPVATAHVFGTAALVSWTEPPAWLVAAAYLWAVAAVIWVAGCVWQRRWRLLAEPLVLAGLFAVLPPLTAFASYFVGVHAPRHMAALVSDPRAPRVHSLRAAVWRSLPLTGMTVAIGAALWPFFPGVPSDRLLTLTLQLLAALTLPHMLLNAIAVPRERRAVSQSLVLAAAER